ncbi:MAG: methyltransferase domain-containing protein [Deltaproteobacteria bacterium]|nr:methyltransferase domain-containing protein [Candidatus Anaeroferrophillacea bacterium]
MKCPICDTNENWHSLDYLRQRRDLGFIICKTCGFTTYRRRSEEELKKFYERSDYNIIRRFAGTADFETKTRKKMNHRMFLGPYLADHRNLQIIDVGCSTGYFLELCRDEYGHQRVCGTEWNPAHARYGRHRLELDIRTNIEDFGPQRYDLICIEHVLEHIAKPDEFLLNLRDNYLAGDGVIACAVPIWYDFIGSPSVTAHEAGGFESILPEGHINVFSLRSFANLLAKCGLHVVQENYSYYGYRVLLEKTPPITDFSAEAWDMQEQSLVRQKAAFEAFVAGRFADAHRHYHRFPLALVKDIDQQQKSPAERITGITQLIAEMPNVDVFHWYLARVYNLLGDYGNAITNYSRAIRLKPNDPIHYWELAEILFKLEEFQRAAALYEKLLVVEPKCQFVPLTAGQPTALDRLGQCYANLPDDIPDACGTTT